MQYLINATTYLSNALISFALYLVLLRFWMQWVKADFRNELGQFIISLTNPLVIPLRRIIPSIGTIDTATLTLAYGICLLKLIVVFLLYSITASSNADIAELFPWSLVMAIGVLLQACIYLFMAAIFISIIASWLAPQSYHPILGVLRSISEPLLAPARKLIPSIGGLDLSPMLVFLFLNVSEQLLVAPLLGFR